MTTTTRIDESIVCSHVTEIAQAFEALSYSSRFCAVKLEDLGTMVHYVNYNQYTVSRTAPKTRVSCERREKLSRQHLHDCDSLAFLEGGCLFCSPVRYHCSG